MFLIMDYIMDYFVEKKMMRSILNEIYFVAIKCAKTLEYEEAQDVLMEECTGSSQICLQPH